jgi:hypothetical protein
LSKKLFFNFLKETQKRNEITPVGNAYHGRSRVRAVNGEARLPHINWQSSGAAETLQVEKSGLPGAVAPCTQQLPGGAQ